MSGRPVAIVAADTAVSSLRFDYDALAPQLAEYVRAGTERIRFQLYGARRALGRELLDVKSRLAFGKFGAWLEAEFEMTERSAETYTGLARFLEDKFEMFSVLPDTAVAALAAPSALPVAVAEIVADVEAGRKPKLREIKQKLASAKTAKEFEDRAKKQRKPRRTDAKRKPQTATETYDANERRQAEEHQRAERLRPLAAYITERGDHFRNDMLAVLGDWTACAALRRLLSESTVGNQP